MTEAYWCLPYQSFNFSRYYDTPFNYSTLIT